MLMSHDMVVEVHLLSHLKNIWSRYRRRFMYQMYRWCKYLFYCKNIGWIIYLYDFFQFSLNGLIQVGVIRINVNWFGIFVIPNYIIFAPNFFIFKIIFVIRIFEIFVASKVFTFIFCCAVPRLAPVGEIQRPYEKLKYVESLPPGPVNLWLWGSNGSWWVHSNLSSAFRPK